MTVELLETETPSTTIKESEKVKESGSYIIFENINIDDQIHINDENQLIMPKVII